MDFGKLLSRAWDLLWNNLFLIWLGVLAVLSGTGSGGSSQARFAFQGDDFHWQDMPQYDFSRPFQDIALPNIALGGILLLAALALLVGLALWALGTIARGGLVSAVDDLEEKRPTGFSAAFLAGWNKGWRLLGIGLIPAIPGLVLMVLAIGSLALGGGWESLQGGGMPWENWSGFMPLIVLACLLVPVGIFLSLLQTFANRACMLEDTGVLASYQRGFEVLGANLGPVVLLFLLQIAISIAMVIILFIPGILSALCCLLWPLLILVQAAFVSYYSTLWTLAWRQWVGTPEVVAV